MSNDLTENLKKLEGHLARFKGEPLGQLLKGAAVRGGGEIFDNASPVNNQVINQVVAGTAADIDNAAKAAWDAYGEWSETPGKERKRILHKVADLIEARAEEIALVESYDTGQPLRFMSKAAIRGAENYRFFADKAPEAHDGRAMPADQHMNYSVRKAIGPVGVITPWNTPFMLSTWKIAPALAAGCTVVHKPAESSPLTAYLLAEIMDEAGLPKGAINVVNGFGHEAGKALTEHPLIKAISFVGESATGGRIMQQGGPTLKRNHLELGGKNPVVVFEDADLDRALDAVIFMIYSLNGERCTSSSRVLIQQSIYDSFAERIVERVNNIKVGHPLDPATEIGPLIDKKHFAKVVSYFTKATEDGATIRAGGEVSNAIEGGNFVKPTLFTEARNNMRIAQEEIFGPVLTAIPFKDEADAKAIANDIEYGLAGYIWTNDINKAMRMAHGVEAGMVWVNSENNRHLPSPFGGVKASGIGRDGGDYSFEFYMETKNICIAFGEHSIPKLGKLT